ncbi:glycosyltransferase [Phreatobacter stygius]|uniref:Glycosyltransferase n=1 Tax=Phreatobacter stygius TaxID=1940610 RepID=A0A4D7B5I6_9HYPH|nr:glycosyltransferase [Phreatobacter stygius]QCI66243.1 glycosyltransferase [Phreatobacter stygius]
MLTGHLDYVGTERISGWARDDSDTERRLILELYDGEQRVARFVADKMRTDLAGAGLGDGRYGFWLQLPTSLFPMPVHRISVRFADTGLDIGGSPKYLYRADPAFDEAFAQWIDAQVDATIAAAETPEQLEPLLGLSTNLMARVLTAIDKFDTLNRSTALGDIDLSTLPDRLRRSAEQLATGLKPIHVPVHAAPRVSIIIASSGRLGDDYALIRSIVQTSKSCAFEIVLVDNTGAVETTLLPFLVRGGARVVRIAKPGGIMAAYADGARTARGTTLFFATGLRELGPDALQILLDTLEREGPASLVAPRLIDADRRLRASGLSIDPLGNKSPIGQGMDAALMRFRILREADDVALNALMIDRQTFAEHGGFEAADMLFDYTMSNLSFALRAAGGKVLVQGASDAVLAGPLVGLSSKSRGRSRFLGRWNQALPKVGEARDDGAARAALFLDEHFPSPDEDAGSAAVFSHVRAFRRLGYHVEFLATQRSKTEELRARLLRARGIEAHDGIDNIDQFLQSRRNQFDVVYVHRYHVAKQVLELARTANPGARVLFSVADLHHIRTERSHAAAAEPGDELAVKTMREEELASVRAADVTITHSDWERDYLAKHVPAARVAVVLWDVAGREPEIAFDRRQGVCFLGSFRHAPNIDAVNHFCQAIWPGAAEAIRHGGFDIVGSHSDLLELRPVPPHVKLVGYVKDIAGYLDQKRLMVAPLRFGAGIKGKVLLSLAHGLPCLMSPIAAEGIPLPAALAHTLVAEDDADFLKKLEALYDDQALWQDTSQAALAWARTTLNEGAIADALEAALAVRHRSAGPELPSSVRTFEARA